MTTDTEKIKIAVIGIPTLVAGHIQTLLGNGYIVVSVSEENISPDEMDSFSCIIVSDHIFPTMMDFFLLRKNRMIVLSSLHPGDIMCREKGRGNLPHIISLYDDPEKVIEIILSVVNKSSSEIIKNKGALTQREKEVLVGIASGKTNKEIAEELYISVHTVVTHRKNISEKLGIRTVSGLSVYALINGLI